MIAEAELQEYLDEIRQDVCSRCVERPLGGPPCGALGKPCGVELHLPQLVEAVHQVHSPLIDPYLDANRREVCPKCPFLHSEFCPCPMDSLAVLVIGAIEAVDERRAQRDKVRQLVASLPKSEQPDIDEVTRAYQEAAGTWTGCDWPTNFGPASLNLERWTAAEAEAHALEVDREGRKDWEAAAHWLAEVEQRAAEAEAEGERAVKAASSGAWGEAVDHARRAWSLEFSTGRAFRRQPASWKTLYETLAVAATVHDDAQSPEARRFSITTL